MDLIFTAGALFLTATICFRISWEAYKWPPRLDGRPETVAEHLTRTGGRP